MVRHCIYHYLAWISRYWYSAGKFDSYDMASSTSEAQSRHRSRKRCNRTVVTVFCTVRSPGMDFSCQRTVINFVHERSIQEVLRRPSHRGLHTFSAPFLAVLSRSHGRRLSITMQGHLGLGPPAMQVGDSVVVIRDAELSLLLLEDSVGKSALTE